MQIVLNKEEMDGFFRFRIVERLDEETRNQGREIFERYQKNGVILNENYTDPSWTICDELKQTTLDFRIDDIAYGIKAAEWTCCTRACFQECLRAFCAFQLGRYAVERLKQICRAVTGLAGMNYEDVREADFKDLSSHVASFIRLLPGGNIMAEQLADELDDYDWRVAPKKKSRKLSEFKYYFRFNSRLSEIWDSADEQEKVRFFPVWFWWKLTTILPLRVTEYLMTPRECIRTEDGRSFLSVRRTRKKKGRRQVYYRVDRDYEIHEYEIPEWMSREILSYKAATEAEPDTSLHTLLIPRIREKFDYLTYKEMSGRLSEFCEAAFGDKNYPVNLGDTRHIAMISLILSGGSPVICRELAGHENIDISANYYGNIATVVETSVYELRHGYSEASFLDGINRYPVRLPEKRIRVSEGWCDVPAVESGDISECLSNYRPGHGMGDCRGCLHFFPDDPGIKVSIRNRFRDDVNEDGLYLMQMIELVRKGYGYEEDIAAALLRIRNSVHRYGRILMTEGDM